MFGKNNSTVEPWARAFAANEAIWRAPYIDACEKQNAWRSQKVLLAHATRTLDERARYDILKDHQEVFSKSRTSDTFLEECLVGCKNLLEQSRRIRAGISFENIKWTMPPEYVFEHSCRGKYESCVKEEITIGDLQRSKSKSLAAPTEPAKKATDMGRTAPKIPKLLGGGAAAFEGFRLARDMLFDEFKQKNKENEPVEPRDIMNYGKKSLGGRGINAKFVQPIKQKEANPTVEDTPSPAATTAVPAALAHLDPDMVQQIMRDSMHKYKSITWEDVAGLDYAKATFMETIIHPLQRPDLFKGVRRPPRGVLLFGPPGTGKTLIAKCIASQSKATFFNINPSSLTSKWVGEGEKLVKTLFAVAAAHQPAIIFMDEVDSLLSQRSDNEHDSSRRLKNEFFIQLDGATTNEDDHIVIIGATNRPQELDEAMRRRFVRRIYVPLPEVQARKKIIEKLVDQVHHNLSDAQIMQLAELTEGYSGADMDSLCRYAAMQPLRTLTSSQIGAIDAQQLPFVTMSDFMDALKHVSKSVSQDDVERYVTWNQIFGGKR